MHAKDLILHTSTWYSVFKQQIIKQRNRRKYMIGIRMLAEKISVKLG